MTDLEFAELNASDACQAFEDALVNESQNLSAQAIEFPRPAPVRPEYRTEAPTTPEIWIDLNGCDQGFHSFGKDEAGDWQAWHGDDSKCEPIEFNLAREAA